MLPISSSLHLTIPPTQSLFLHNPSIILSPLSPQSLLASFLVFWDSCYLLRNPNDSESRSAASITRRLALLVTTLSEIIGAGVDDDGASEDALETDELDEVVGDGAFDVALGVGLEVAEVANVALLVGGGAMGFETSKVR